MISHLKSSEIVIHFFKTVRKKRAPKVFSIGRGGNRIQKIIKARLMHSRINTKEKQLVIHIV